MANSTCWSPSGQCYPNLCPLHPSLACPRQSNARAERRRLSAESKSPATKVIWGHRRHSADRLGLLHRPDSDRRIPFEPREHTLGYFPACVLTMIRARLAWSAAFQATLNYYPSFDAMLIPSIKPPERRLFHLCVSNFCSTLDLRSWSQ